LIERVDGRGTVAIVLASAAIMGEEDLMVMALPN
jgi:hypothetical protein